MDPGVFPTTDEATRLFQEVVARHDAPAHARRGRQVELAWHDLLARCRQQRTEWLQMPTLRLGQLLALAGAVERLRPWLGDPADRDALTALADAWQPRLRLPLAATASPRRLVRALHELVASFERFNRLWLAYLHKVDLRPLNAERHDYNRYYLLEKECALRSPVLARVGFRRLEPLATADLLAALPLLPVPALFAD